MSDIKQQTHTFELHSIDGATTIVAHDAEINGQNDHIPAIGFSVKSEVSDQVVEAFLSKRDCLYFGVFLLGIANEWADRAIQEAQRKGAESPIKEFYRGLGPLGRSK